MKKSEILSAFNGKWVAVKITKMEGLDIAEGEVLFSGNSFAEVNAAVKKDKLYLQGPINVIFAKEQPAANSGPVSKMGGQ